MAKKQPRYLVLEYQYLSDGVSAWLPEFEGTLRQCEKYAGYCFDVMQGNTSLRIVKKDDY